MSGPCQAPHRRRGTQASLYFSQMPEQLEQQLLGLLDDDTFLPPQPPPGFLAQPPQLSFEISNLGQQGLWGEPGFSVQLPQLSFESSIWGSSADLHGTSATNWPVQLNGTPAADW